MYSVYIFILLYYVVLWCLVFGRFTINESLLTYRNRRITAPSYYWTIFNLLNIIILLGLFTETSTDNGNILVYIIIYNMVCKKYYFN